TLGYKMALDEDPSGHLAHTGVASWFLDRIGLQEDGWICPSAPDKHIPTNLTEIRGSVNSAWMMTPEGVAAEASQLFPSLESLRRLDDYGHPRPASPKVRAGSYALNLWLFCGDLPPGGWTPLAALLTLRAYRREPDISEPSLAPILCDSLFWGAW